MAQPNYEKLFGEAEAHFFQLHRQLFDAIYRLESSVSEHPRVVKLAEQALIQAPVYMNYQSADEIIDEIVATDFTTFKCPDTL